MPQSVSSATTSSPVDDVDLDLTIPDPSPFSDIAPLPSVNPSIDAHHKAYAYVAGHYLRRFITCPECLSKLFSSQKNLFIDNKLYNKSCNLCNPCSDLVADVELLKVKCFSLLDQVAHHDNVTTLICSHTEISTLFNFDFIHEKCRKSVQDTLTQTFVKFFVKQYCKHKNNKILQIKRKTEKKIKKLK